MEFSQECSQMKLFLNNRDTMNNEQQKQSLSHVVDDFVDKIENLVLLSMKDIKTYFEHYSEYAFETMKNDILLFFTLSLASNDKYALKRLLYKIDTLRRSHPRKMVIVMKQLFPDKVNEIFIGKKQPTYPVWIETLKSIVSSYINIKLLSKKQNIKLYKDQNNLQFMIPTRKISVKHHPLLRTAQTVLTNQRKISQTKLETVGVIYCILPRITKYTDQLKKYLSDKLKMNITFIKNLEELENKDVKILLILREFFTHRYYLSLEDDNFIDPLKSFTNSHPDTSIFLISVREGVHIRGKDEYFFLFDHDDNKRIPIVHIMYMINNGTLSYSDADNQKEFNKLKMAAKIK